MDPLSILAASIAFLGALSTTIEAARNLWGTPDRQKALASELSEFTEPFEANEHPSCQPLQLFRLVSNPKLIGIYLFIV
jgi:hypothetical protein